jgi:uncharacterized protein with PIN domain
MKYHIATDEQIKNSLKKILKNNRTVNTQAKLRKLVTKDLNTKKKKYGIAAGRIRNIAINSDFAKLEIHSREGDPKKSLNKCPVCSGTLNKVKNQTIWGGKVTIEFRCKNCGYWTGKKKRIPTRYVFHYKK